MKWYHWIGIGTGVLLLGGVFNRERVMSDLKKVKLGEFFDLAEFTKTSTGFDNIPPAHIIENLKKLVFYIFDPLRRAIEMPLTITSGYRSNEVNDAVPGSSSTSQHPKGEAGDSQVLIRVPNTGQTEAQAKAQAFAKIPSKTVTTFSLTINNIESYKHNSDSWGFKFTNQTLVDIVRKLKLPYDQIIDEQRGKSLWVHISYSTTNKPRLAWLTRRDPSAARPREYETIKIGYA